MAESKANASIKIFEKWRRRSVADEITECWICNGELVKPRSLPCMHSFCESCLLALLQTYERKGQLERAFRCPQCKAIVPYYIPEKVSEQWLRMFPTKRSIDNMKDAINLIEEMCKPCSEKWKIIPATKFCVDCQNFYCGACEQDHRGLKENKKHKIVNYELKELKNTPASNISKFHCLQHKNLRFSIYCETHAQFLCNSCIESGQHRHCRTRNDVIDLVRSITKSEAKLHVINHLKHDERNLGKEHMRMIEQIDGIQRELQELRTKQENIYCNYVMQATITDRKTGALDALKGKLEFDKNHRTHEPVSKTMTRVETILSEFTSIFTDNTEDKAVRRDMHKAINDIEKILKKDDFGEVEITVRGSGGDTESKQSGGAAQHHKCIRHVEKMVAEDDILRLGKAMMSVGFISYSRMTGTVFRVGTRYVMTAAHIVRDIVDPERDKDSDWSALEDRDVFVKFGSSTDKQEDVYSISSQVPFLNDELDVAVLQLNRTDNLPPPLSLSTKNIPEQDFKDISTISYRQAGQPQKFIETGCGIFKQDSDLATAATKWLKDEERRQRCSLIIAGKEHSTLNWNYNALKDQTKLAVDASGDYRSFGSPLLAVTGRSSVKVIAITIESGPECYFDLPSKIQETFPPEFRFQLATKMSSVYNIVSTESRDLANDIFLVDERL